MIEVAFPTRIDVSTRFMDRFTLGDVARLVGPVVGGWLVGRELGVLTGFLAGLVLVLYTPQGQHLDEHLRRQSGPLQRSGTVACPERDKLVDDTAILDDGTALGLVRVTPCDLASITESEQEAHLEAVHDLMKTLDYPLEIHSRQRKIDLTHTQGAGDSVTVTDHLLVVRVPLQRDPLTEADQKRMVDQRCSEIREVLGTGDLHTERLTGYTFKKTVGDLDFDTTTLSGEVYKIEDEETPIHQLRYVTDYPDQLDLAWIADILDGDAPGRVTVVQRAEPISTYQRDLLEKKVTTLTVELRQTDRPGRATHLRRQLRDAEDMLEIEDRGEALVNYGVYIVVCGATPDEAEETWTAVRSVLRTKQVETEVPSWRTRQAVTAESAFQPDGLDETLIVPARAAAAGFPFDTYVTAAEDGIVIGHDSETDKPVMIDRTASDAGHQVVLGKPGAGKSYWTGLMILRSAHHDADLEIHILDPTTDDYQGITDALEGTTVVLDTDTLGTIDPGGVTRYTVTDPSRDNTALLVDAVQHIYREAARTDSETLVVLDEASRLLTDGNGVHEPGVRAVSRLVRRGRHQNIAVTLVTQNAADFTRSPLGKTILRNVDAYLFFKHPTVRTAVDEFFNLSASAAAGLRTLETGDDDSPSQALLHGPVDTKFTITATADEHHLITNAASSSDSGDTSIVEYDEDTDLDTA